MYAQTERGTTVDWVDHIIVMIYAIAGALYSIYLAGVGVYGIFVNTNLMFTKPSPGTLGAVLLSVLLIAGGLVLANTAFGAFRRMLREGPNPSVEVIKARKPSFISQIATQLFPELQDPSKTPNRNRNQNLTPQQARRIARDEQREELTEQLRKELARRRTARTNKKKRRKH
jgi:hypothetical protein